MAKELISRCDKCGTSEGVEEITITYKGKTREVDACPEHAGPALELFELGADKPTAAPARRGGGRSGHAVVPIEDWDPSLLNAPAEPAQPAQASADATLVDARPAREPARPVEAAADPLRAELLAAFNLVGKETLSVKVMDALFGLMRAAEGGQGVRAGQAAVLALNPQRIRVPNTPEGQSFRAALTAFVDHHKGEK